MITVTFKQRPVRPGQRQDNPTYYVTGMINGGLNSRSHIWTPPTDVYELEDRVDVVMEIAGMDEEGFTVTLDHQILIISGTRADPINERKAFHQMEIRYGEFRSMVEIPIPIDLDTIEAEYRNGFLLIHLPKAQPKQIRIQQD